MQIYLAPMEGITGYTYRNVYRRHFEDADKYFTPFISTHEKLGNKVKNEIKKENNEGISLIPQIMIGSAEEAEGLCKLILPYGYNELNINAGCPSGTVVSKFRGAGLLRKPDELDRMLEKIFDSCSCRFSIKTRLGWDNIEEWDKLARIYGRYPFTEVIIHARVKTEFYSGTPHYEAMEKAHEYIHLPTCYNGDVCSVSDIDNLYGKYPWLDSVMIGRGLLQNPLLFEQIKNITGTKSDNERIYDFMEDMFETYLAQFKSEINTLYHMKELWCHLGKSFPEHTKELKTIRKTKSVSEYKLAVRNILK